MRKLILFAVLLLVSSCTVVEVGKVSPERQHLYDYNNNDEYCQKNPNRCVNNVPW